MTRLLTFTPAQIVAIYEAGMERGNEEAAAFDWGSHAAGGKFYGLENSLVWDQQCREVQALEYDAKKVWFEQFLKDAGETK